MDFPSHRAPESVFDRRQSPADLLVIRQIIATTQEIRESMWLPRTDDYFTSKAEMTARLGGVLRANVEAITEKVLSEGQKRYHSLQISDSTGVSRGGSSHWHELSAGSKRRQKPRWYSRTRIVNSLPGDDRQSKEQALGVFLDALGVVAVSALDNREDRDLLEEVISTTLNVDQYGVQGTLRDYIRACQNNCTQ